MFLRLLRPAPDEPHASEVDGHVEPLVGDDRLPGLPHVVAPADIVQDEECFVVRLFLELLEVMQGRRTVVMTVDEDEVVPDKCGVLEKIAERGADRRDAAELPVIEGLAGFGKRHGAAFDRYDVCSGTSFLQVNGPDAQRCPQFENGFRLEITGQLEQHIAVNAFARAGIQQLPFGARLLQLFGPCAEINNGKRSTILTEFSVPFFSLNVKIFINLCR